MTTHGPHFVPTRLREALDEQQKTIKALAESSQVSDYTISRYLRGESTPGPAILRVLAEQLGKPEGFFFRSTLPLEGSPIFWRSYAAATKRVRQRGVVLMKWLRETSNYLMAHVELPTPKFPVFQLPALPQEITAAQIESLAQATRSHWGLREGPIANMVRLVEFHGGIVSRFNVGSQKLDAFSQWAHPEECPYFVLSADKSAAVRSRWDLAHELGHILLHRHMDTSVLATPEVHKLAEKQADRFAGAFLLPATSFSRSVFVPTFSALLVQKDIWKVSVAAMLMRLRQLRLIGDDQALRLWQNYGRRGMRMREPMDDTIPIEEPTVLRRGFEMLFEQGVVSPEQVVSDLSFQPPEIQAFAHLPIGFLKDSGPTLRLRKGTTASGSGTVLPFRLRKA